MGVLSTSKPRLVTSLFLRTVPPGTNGGMSLLGTTASAAGGLFIGVVFWLMSFVVHVHPPVPQWPIVLVGLVSGFLGSLYDSLLGATLQASYYSQDRKCIVKDPKKRLNDKSVQLVCGTDVLSNEAVNFISILFTMITIFYLAPYFWSPSLV